MAFLFFIVIIAFIIYMFVRDGRIKKTDEFKKQINSGTKPSKFLWHRKWWVWVIIIVLIFCSFGGMDSGDDDSNSSSSKPTTHKVEKKKSSTKSVAKSSKNSSSESSSSKASSQASSKASASKPKIPSEYKNALITAEEYNETQPMSKAGLYNQLTSKDGEAFTQAAGQYAVDHLNADWNKNALKCAKEYEKTEHLSRADLQQQLSSSVSDGGEGFTASQVQYAMSHLN